MSQTEFTPLPKQQSFQADPLGGFNQYCTLEQAQATRLIFNEVVATVAAAMSRIPVIPENGLSIPEFCWCAGRTYRRPGSRGIESWTRQKDLLQLSVYRRDLDEWSKTQHLSFSLQRRHGDERTLSLPE